MTERHDITIGLCDAKCRVENEIYRVNKQLEDLQRTRDDLVAAISFLSKQGMRPPIRMDG